MGTDGVAAELDRATRQLALLMQARDARQWGHVVDGVVHPTWEEASLIGQEEYLRDAAFLVGAFQVIGWSPNGERDRARDLAARLEEELARADARIAEVLRYADQVDPSQLDEFPLWPQTVRAVLARDDTEREVIPGGCVYCGGSGVIEDYEGDRDCSGCSGTGTPTPASVWDVEDGLRAEERRQERSE